MYNLNDVLFHIYFLYLIIVRWMSWNVCHGGQIAGNFYYIGSYGIEHLYFKLYSAYETITFLFTFTTLHDTETLWRGLHRSDQSWAISISETWPLPQLGNSFNCHTYKSIVMDYHYVWAETTLHLLWTYSADSAVIKVGWS